jgi:chromosome segregation ATPase
MFKILHGGMTRSETPPESRGLSSSPTESGPAAVPSVDNEDLVQKITALCIEHERFSENIVREFSKIGRHLANVLADNKLAEKRLWTMATEHAAAQDQLFAVGARNEGLKTENAHLTAAAAAASARLERVQAELHATREQLNALQLRNESLSADHAHAMGELDEHRRDLINIRHQLSERTQKHTQARAEADQARIREANAETRLRMAAVDAESDRAEAARAARRVAEHAERTLSLTNELQVTREQVRAAIEERDAITAERDRIASEANALKLKLEETHRKLDAKIDGLSHTKTFLFETNEKQRQQIADQSERIAQLEQSNSKLSYLLSESSKSFPILAAEEGLGGSAQNKVVRIQQ